MTSGRQLAIPSTLLLGALKEKSLEAGDPSEGQNSNQGQEEDVASRCEEERANPEGFLRKRKMPCYRLDMGNEEGRLTTS